VWVSEIEPKWNSRFFQIYQFRKNKAAEPLAR
jgi:hypothetical protein